MATPWEWDPTSSGSGAGNNDEEDYYEEEQDFGMQDWNSYEDEEAPPQESDTFAGDSYVASQGHTLGSSELKQGELFNHKVPPAFDGNMSWFTFEEYVKDWIEITSIDVKQRGPMLRNRLKGNAQILSLIHI